MCAIFGLIDYGRVFNSKQRERILRVLSIECEERGIDATGYAFNENNRLMIVKKPVPAHEMKLRLRDESNVILGHTRMATQGNAANNFNNHPFFGKAGETKFALAHNGILHNDILLRKELGIPISKIKTDSYIAVQILEKYGDLSEKTLAEMAGNISGSFVFTLLDSDNNSYFVRGNNPLALYKFKAGFYIYASTEQILDDALRMLGLFGYEHEKIQTHIGDIIKINADGNLTRSEFTPSDEDDFDYFYPPCYCMYETDSALQLKRFANTLGVYPEDIELLLNCGYDEDEIAELICDPIAFRSTMEMLMEF